MKIKQLQELKAKPTAELEKLHGDYEAKLKALQFDLAAGKVKNIQDIRNLKKDVARILTILRASETNA